MKERDVYYYPQALIDASKVLMINEKLLSVFVCIVFKQTKQVFNISAYDTKSVFASLELVNEWFQLIHANNVPFPASFDFTFFYQGIFLLIDMDHSLNSSKCLWFLYRMAHILPATERIALIDQILNIRFYKLFFNWSWNIRNLFYQFLVFQVEFGFDQQQISERQNRKSISIKPQASPESQKRPRFVSDFDSQQFIFNEFAKRMNNLKILQIQFDKVDGIPEETESKEQSQLYTDIMNEIPKELHVYIQKLVFNKVHFLISIL